MCGINGIHCLHARTEIESIKKMNSALLNRGPDHQQYKIVGKRCVFGHTLLAIKGTIQNSIQPISYKGISVIMNGEIYNYGQLRRRYGRSYAFKTESDAEVLIPLYQEFGEGLFDKIDGEYAIALYDSKMNTLLAGVDHLAIKPFYYYQDNNVFIFSSQTTGILAHPIVKKSFNKEALYHAFTLGSCLTKDTLFDNIYKLEPGTHLCYIQNKHSIHAHAPLVKSMGAYAKSPKLQVLNLIQDSIIARSKSNTKITISMSGGIDSSLVGYLAKSQRKDLLSISFDSSRLKGGQSEERYIDMVNEIIKTKNISCKPKKTKTGKFLKDIIGRIDDFVFHPSMFSLHTIYSTANKHDIRVVLSGDGADELFFGYDYYLLLNDMFRSKDPLHFISVFDEFFQKGPLLSVKNNLLQGLHPFYSNHFYFNDQQKQLLFTNAFLQKKIPTEKVISRQLMKYSQYDKLNQFLVGEILFKFRQPLTIIDRLSSSFHVENRLPFLHQKLMHLALAIPVKEKLKNNKTKYILKKIAGSIFPSHFINRKKSGLTFPMHLLFKKKKIIKKILNCNLLTNTDLFSRPYIYYQLNKFVNQTNRHPETNNLTPLIIFFFLWYDYYFDNKKILDNLDK